MVRLGTLIAAAACAGIFATCATAQTRTHQSHIVAKRHAKKHAHQNGAQSYSNGLSKNVNHETNRESKDFNHGVNGISKGINHTFQHHHKASKKNHG